MQGLIEHRDIFLDYPFGMVMPGRNWTAASAEGYRFGFGGMENDDEVKGANNSLDFGARIYDPRLGRLLTIDPNANQYSYQTPYIYASNNPIYCIDVEGKSGIGYITGEKNEKTGRPILKVVSNVYLYGTAATETRATAMNTSLNSQYNQIDASTGEANYFTWTDADGITYDVQFDIKVSVKDYSGIENDIKISTTADNFYYVDDNPERKYSKTGSIPGLGGNVGILTTSDIDANQATDAHEMAHGYGGKDHPNPTEPITLSPGDIIPIYIPSTQKYNDGTPLDLSDRKVTQSDITFILNHSEFAETPGLKQGEIGVNTAKFPDGAMQKPNPESPTDYTDFE